VVSLCDGKLSKINLISAFGAMDACHIGGLAKLGVEP
jgi:hypothetical protein